MYQLSKPPEYIDVSGSKNTVIKTIIVLVITLLTFVFSILPFLPSLEDKKDYYNDVKIIGYSDEEAQKEAEKYYTQQFNEGLEAGFGSCLALALFIGVISFGLTSIFLPNEKKIENSKKFKEYHKFCGNVYVANLKSKISNIPDVEMVIWSTDNELHISSNRYQDDFGEIIVPYKNIVFFVRDGDFYTKTELNRDGRIIGGLIAGPTGFLVGTNTSAQTIEVDKRQTILYLECEGKEETWLFSSATYDGFMSLIPQFEYKKVVSKPQAIVNNNSNNIEQIKQLKELLDIGAISQSEFDLKKKELLNKI